MTKRLLLLNGLAVIGVAMHHASGYGTRAMFMWTDRYLPVTVPNFDQVGSLPFYVVVLMQQLDAFTLPAFMFVSGFFVAFAAQAGRGMLKWHIVGQRVKYLAVPFLVWTAIYFALANRRPPSSLDEILSRYYYIPLLCQYYVLSPFLVVLAKQFWKPLLLGAGIAELGAVAMAYLSALEISWYSSAVLGAFTPKWLVPNLMLWFCLGLVVGLHRPMFTAWLARTKRLWIACLLILIPATMLEYELAARVSGKEWLGPYFGGFSRTAYALAFILSFLAVDKLRLPFDRVLDQLGSRSLGIYLAHAPIMYLAAVLLYREAPWVLGSQLLYQGLLILVALSTPILLMECWHRMPVRKLYRYIFG